MFYKETSVLYLLGIIVFFSHLIERNSTKYVLHVVICPSFKIENFRKSFFCLESSGV